MASIGISDVATASVILRENPSEEVDDNDDDENDLLVL